MQDILRSEATAARRSIPISLKLTDGSPATGYTLVAADLKVQKQAGNFANCAGTLPELTGGNGDYAYIATAGEVDTFGIFRGKFEKTGYQTVRFAVQITALDPYTAFALTILDLGIVEQDTAVAVTGSTIRFKSGTVGAYPGQFVRIRSSTTGFNQTSVVSSYSAGTETATIDPTWAVTPTGTIIYDLMIGPAAPVTYIPTVNIASPYKSGIQKNVALANFQFQMTDSINHAPALAQTVSVTRVIDGGTFSAGTLSAVTEIGAGLYRVNFGAGDLNGDVVTLRATAPGCDDTLVTIVTDPT